MIQAFLNRQIDKAERDLGVPLDYARYIARASLKATWKIAKFTKLVQVGRGPLNVPLHVASIVGAMADDCGSCVQIGVNLARKDGVKGDVLTAVIHRQPEQLPDELRDVYAFAHAVTLDEPQQHDLRERIRERYGDHGLVEISLAIALHRVFPTLKRGLGYAKSCSQVTVSV